MKRSDIFWVFSFILGFGFAFGVVAVPVGLGLFIFMNTLLGSLWFFGKRNEVAKELKSTSESIWFMRFITVSFVILSIPYLYRLDTSIIATLVSVQALLLLFGAWFFALPSILHIADVFMMLFAPIVGGITWLVESLKAIVSLFKDNSNVVKTLLKIVFYSTISLMIFVIFANFLSDADPEFKKRIDIILESLQLSEVAGRALLGVLVTFVAAGLLTVVGYMQALNVFGTNAEKAKVRWEDAFKTIFARKSDAMLPIIITVPILLMFGLYVWVQFKYLFGQDINVVLGNYTFAEYVHRGFLELLTVGALSYPILSWSMNRAKSKWAVARYTTFAINSGIVALLGIMLYSLLVRMNIYMESYGPSLLRMYVLVGAIFVGIALVLYEVLALFKAYYAGYRMFKGKFLGDYTIIALFTGLSLLAAVSLFPWSSYMVGEIKAYYKETGKIDIFQLVELSDEAQPQVYTFAEELIADGKDLGGLLVKAHAVQVRDEYAEARKSSLFTNIFGMNIGGQALLNTIPTDSENVVYTEYTNLIEEKTENLTSTYLEALIDNDFNAARELFDPKMKNNDIVGFSESTSIKLVPVSDYQRDALKGDDVYWKNSLVIGDNKSFDHYASIDIVRRGTDLIENVKDEVTVYSLSKEEVVRSSIDLRLAFRNGDLYLTDSTLILNYLPDAVGNNVTSLYSLGYSSYCVEPTLDVIFSEDRGCNAEDSQKTDFDQYRPEFVEPVGYALSSNFYKSDFVAESKKEE